MNPGNYPDIPPRKKTFKRLISKAVLFALGRGLQSLSKHEPLIQQEVSTWPEGFTLMMSILPNNGSMALSRGKGGTLLYRGASFNENQANVIIYLKSLETAFALLTGQLGIDMGYARNSMSARGDLANTVSVVRVLNITEAYLFPAFISHKLMKQLPPIPLGRKHLLRMKAYFLGVPFGI